MSLTKPPINYLVYNSQSTKKIAIVIDIPGLDYLVSTQIGRQIEYGDDVDYGDPGLLYGGLVPVGFNPGERGQKIIVNLDSSSLTISQKLEPEQGRAAISTLSFSFIDKDQYMTQAVTPGKIIPEILGQQVRVWVGYAQTSFPGDFYVLWIGRVSQVNAKIGVIDLQLSDPSIIERQKIYTSATTDLTMDIDAIQTTIPVASNGDFFKKILGPDGTYDTTIKLYIQIEDEIIEYQQTGHESDGFGVNQFVNVVRGARGTTAAAHTAPTDPTDTGGVTNTFEISGHAIDIALKTLLSGWGGPCIQDQALSSIVQTGDFSDPTEPTSLILPNNMDAVRDLGLTVGDFITVTGSAIPGNNVTCIVEGFINVNSQTNRGILTNFNFTAEATTTAVIAIRSQYDTYPDEFGSQLPTNEVAVSDFTYYKDTYLNGAENSYRFYNYSEVNGKTFIESEIMLPLGAYSLTRQGKLSMGLTKPSIADERTTTVDNTNVINPQGITLQRGLNNRKYFNEIDWTYDYDDAGDPTNTRATIDTTSLNLIGLSSVLPIDSQGARTDLDFELVADRRERFLLNRYSMAAVLLNIQVNFGAGNLIEAGDIVILKDQGGLQIPNMATGVRDFGVQLLEVINRSVDLKSGIVTLQLEGGVGALANDRYATISPSSLVDAGTTSSRIRIKESFGALYPSQEYLKWKDYVGLEIHVHSFDYSISDTTTFVGLDPSDPHVMNVSPPLSFTPSVDHIVDIVDYPNNTNKLDQALYKLVHDSLDPSVVITSGVSHSSFNVSSGDALKFNVGINIYVHNDDYTVFSDEFPVESVVGTLVTITGDLGFTPSAGQRVELIGFPDGGGPYRFV